MDKHMISSRVDDAMPAILDELKEFVAIESISASSFDQNTLKESAAWIASRVEKVGFGY